MLNEVRVKDEHPFWTKLGIEIARVVWRHEDIIEPYLENNTYYKVFDSDDRFKSMKVLLGITNLIDSLVGEIIDDGVTESAKSLSKLPYYSDIQFYLKHQAASEIIHKKVYNKQFILFIEPSQRDTINQKATELLQPLVTAAEGCDTSVKQLMLCFTIESILIPVIFNYINDLKTIVDSEATSDNIAKQILTTIYSANRLILRDEMLHVSGGGGIISELSKLNLIKRSDIDEAITVVKTVVVNIMKEINSTRQDVFEALECVTYGIFYGKYINYDQFPCLSFIKATFPSIDGFFKGSVTSYINGSGSVMEDPVIL